MITIITIVLITTNNYSTNTNYSTCVRPSATHFISLASLNLTATLYRERALFFPSYS